MSSMAYKIDLQKRTLTFSIRIDNRSLDDTHIYAESTRCQLIIDNVLHNVILFLLTEIQPRIPQAHITIKILLLCAYIFSSLNIETLSLFQDESI